jgi:hypothetical protein
MFQTRALYLFRRRFRTGAHCRSPVKTPFGGGLIDIALPKGLSLNIWARAKSKGFDALRRALARFHLCFGPSRRPSAKEPLRGTIFAKINIIAPGA